MKIEFLGQPFCGDRRAGHLLEQALAAARSAWIVCAWAQLSGLKYLKAELLRLRGRGIDTAAVVGIDLGFATREALNEVIALFQTAHVFHDPGGRTFHPKVYCVEADSEVFVLLGSSNLTEGGLFLNYEANVAVSLRRGEPGDDAFHRELCAFRDRLRGQGMPCLPLDRSLLGRLAQDPDMVTGEAERAARRRHAPAAERLARDIFGEPPDLPTAPPVPPTPQPAPTGGRPAAGRPGPSDARPLRWWKPLTDSDAMRKPRGNARRYVVLNQVGHDIDHLTWFRHDFFAPARWASEPMKGGVRNKDIAIVPFEVFVGDSPRGHFNILVDHDERRTQNPPPGSPGRRRNNAPTYLNWSGLADVIREHNYTGWYLILERFDPDRFRLRLTQSQPG
jgi:hypothetical protein